MQDALTKWFFFRLALGWIPFIFGFCSITWFKTSPAPIPIESLYNGGQLWLVGFALCGGAIGEVSFSQLKGGLIKASLLSITFVLGVFGAYAFSRTPDVNAYCTALIKASSENSLACAEQISLNAWRSIVFYCISAVVAFLTIVFCERIKKLSSSIPPNDKG